MRKWKFGNKFKALGLTSLLLIVLVAYNNCELLKKQGEPSELQFTDEVEQVAPAGEAFDRNAIPTPPPPGSTPTPTNTDTTPTNPFGNALSSVEAFSQTVYPLTRAHCITCHRNLFTPFHAADNASDAHDAVLNTFKVNFNNIPQSRLVIRLRDDQHNCWDDCEANANEMQQAIVTWQNLMTPTPTSGGGSQPTPTPSPDAMTSQSDTLKNELDLEGNLPSGTILLDSQMATLLSPMALVQESLQNYVHVPPSGNNAVKTANDNTSGIAYFTFNVPANALYKMFAYVKAESDSENSFYAKIDSMDTYEWHIPLSSEFSWRELTQGTEANQVNIFLPAGTRILQIREREDGTELSKILLTQDPNFDISTLGDSTRGTLRFDISNLLGGENATFEIDVEEFDSSSYRFQNPRIVGHLQAIRVKNIKLFINGNYNPQHSTYTLVDTTLQPGQSNLSNASMIAIKDQGFDNDRISFSFEILSLETTP